MAWSRWLTKQLPDAYRGRMGTTVVNVGEAKTRFSRLLALAESGEVVIVARDGKPVVQLTVVEPAKRRFGFRTLDVPDSAFFDALPDAELGLWEGAEG